MQNLFYTACREPWALLTRAPCGARQYTIRSRHPYRHGGLWWPRGLALEAKLNGYTAYGSTNSGGA